MKTKSSQRGGPITLRFEGEGSWVSVRDGGERRGSGITILFVNRSLFDLFGLKPPILNSLRGRPITLRVEGEGSLVIYSKYL